MTRPPAPAQPSGAAAFFDLDRTVIARSSILAFARPFAAEHLIDRRLAVLGTLNQLHFSTLGATGDQLSRMRDQLGALVTGWDAAQVRRIVTESAPEVIEPLIYPGARELIAEHRARGHRIVLVSASTEEIVAPIGALLGADDVLATRMTVRDGRFTGEADSLMLGPTKAQAMLAYIEQHALDPVASYAYSDSITDVPMLEVVGHPVATNPDRELARVARDRGWQVLRFRLPRTDTLVRGVAVTVGATAAATAVGLLVGRRRAA